MKYTANAQTPRNTHGNRHLLETIVRTTVLRQDSNSTVKTLAKESYLRPEQSEQGDRSTQLGLLKTYIVCFENIHCMFQEYINPKKSKSAHLHLLWVMGRQITSSDPLRCKQAQHGRRVRVPVVHAIAPMTRHRIMASASRGQTNLRERERERALQKDEW